MPPPHQDVLSFIYVAELHLIIFDTFVYMFIIDTGLYFFPLSFSGFHCHKMRWKCSFILSERDIVRFILFLY